MPAAAPLVAAALARVAALAAVALAAALALAALVAAALAPAADASDRPARFASRPPVPAGDAWRLPVRGDVVRAFAYDERRPFDAGARRGVDIAAGSGAPVSAACSGRVSHAGRVPQRGFGVSVRCGRLTATHLGLGALTVRRGDRVRRGRRIGRVGRSGVVRLGARVTARRFGWVDPLTVVGPRSPPPARPPIPAGPPPRPRRPPGQAPAGQRVPARPAPAPHREVPVLAWLGAALLVGGLPLGTVATLRRSRSRQARRSRQQQPA